MNIEFNSDKRHKTLKERGLDFTCAEEIFTGHHFTTLDQREGYGEDRYITVGKLGSRMIVMVWTPRGESRRIISMRKANEREQKLYAYKLG